MINKATVFLSLLLLTFFSLLITKAYADGDPQIVGWNESQPFTDGSTTSHPLASFLANGYYYVLLANRDIKYAKIQSDGSLGNWQTASTQHNEGLGRGYTAVVVNNVPFLLRFGRVEKLDINSQTGDILSITQVGSEQGGNDSIGGSFYYWNTAVTTNFGNQQYVYHLGGFDCCQDPHYSNNSKVYRVSNTASDKWDWVYMGDGPYGNAYKAVFYKVPNRNYGYIITSDLNPDSKPMYAVKVNSNGDFVGKWRQLGDLPVGSGNNIGDFFIDMDTLFVIRGNRVWSMPSLDINLEDLSIGSWSSQFPNDLPVIQIDKIWEPSVGTDHTEGQSYGVLNNTVYVTGPKKVYYSKIADGSITPTPSNIPTPTTTTSSKPGDANGDNLVDIRDFEVLRQEFNKTGIEFRADFNNDGKVDIRDFEILRQNFNK